MGEYIPDTRAHRITQRARRLATVDHIVPVFLGGSDSLSNLVSSCRLCNSSRGHQEFVDYVQRVTGGDLLAPARTHLEASRLGGIV